MIIDIKVKGTKTKPLKDFENFQGNLKSLPSDKLEKLKTNILKNGFISPIFLWKGNNYILDGHQRITALKSLIYEGHGVSSDEGLGAALPYIEIEAKDKTEAAKYVLAYNSQFGNIERQGFVEFTANFDIDIPSLSEEVALDFDFSSVGDHLRVNGDGTVTEEKELEEDDYEVPEVLETDVKQGDVYILGDHLLMCGDSTSAEDVSILMNDEKADAGFTDPPYNINYQDLAGKHNKIANDQLQDNEFKEFLKSTLVFMPKNSYICCNWKYYHIFYSALFELNNPVKSCIVWDKETRVQNLDKYFKQHEFILYTGKLGGEKTLRGDVYRFNRERSTVHPTMKPIGLCATFIKDSTKLKDIVLDLFGGRGSTLIACEELGRKCRMMELSPKYVQVIIDRWEKYTGQVAKKV